MASTLLWFMIVSFSSIISGSDHIRLALYWHEDSPRKHDKFKKQRNFLRTKVTELTTLGLSMDLQDVLSINFRKTPVKCAIGKNNEGVFEVNQAFAHDARACQIFKEINYFYSNFLKEDEKGVENWALLAKK